MQAVPSIAENLKLVLMKNVTTNILKLCSTYCRKGDIIFSCLLVNIFYFFKDQSKIICIKILAHLKNMSVKQKKILPFSCKKLMYAFVI